MFGPNISGISATSLRSDDSDSSGEDITIRGETRSHKVDSAGGASISQSTLRKGVKAEGNIIVKENSNIQHDTVSRKGEITASDSVLQNIKARKDITLSSVTAEKVTSVKGTIFADSCTLDSLEGNQSVEIKSSTIKESLTLHIDPSKPCTLLLEGSEIQGDIIIEAKSNEVDSRRIAAIASGSSIGKMVADDCSISDVAVGSGGVYRSISEIPPSLVAMALKFAKEGQTVSVGNLQCVVKNKALEAMQKKPVTLEQIKKKISIMIGPNATCSRFEMDGGVYKVTKGKVEVIKASPGLKIDSEASDDSLPKVTVEVKGGKLKGKIIFNNCQGTPKLLDGAVNV